MSLLRHAVSREGHQEREEGFYARGQTVTLPTERATAPTSRVISTR